ncbi:hypothetical protein [Nocardia terpenica]|uniref:Uncharacterized protein n=1 Tax=Nocardia terpenica TaxID=455432 RepID=A0A6G9ZDZ8_9NOCA|nr:hypothetical protein [Nocardia terpenica]QIS23577.1 hypothetical protein F6W96_40210 [Nocardia terpenica]
MPVDRQITWPEIEQHRDFIVAMTKAGVTRQTIWQRLRDEHGLTASVSSLKRYMDANLPEENLRRRVAVLREDPPAGAAYDLVKTPDHSSRGSYSRYGGGCTDAPMNSGVARAFVIASARAPVGISIRVIAMDDRRVTDQHDPVSLRLLERIGIRTYWYCAESGAGAGSVACWLAGRYPDSRVAGCSHPQLTLLQPSG